MLLGGGGSGWATIYQVISTFNLKAALMYIHRTPACLLNGRGVTQAARVGEM